MKFAEAVKRIFRTWFRIVATVVILVTMLLWAPERMVQRAVSSSQKTSTVLTTNDYGKLVDDYRKTLAQILIGLGALGTLYFSWQRSTIERETLLITKQTFENVRDSKITERFAQAVELLGAIDKDSRKLVEVRFGGIFALERVALDSPTDHWTVMEILTAYVRENAPWKEGADPSQNTPLRLPRDIQAILSVIGRRKVEHDAGKDRKIELGETDLRSANLSNAYLKGAQLYRANLRGAYFYGANLSLAYLREACLQDAILDHAQMESTFLDDAHLERASLKVTHLKMAYLVGAHLDKADLRFSDLTDTNFKDAKLNGANLDQARLNGTYLKGADLTSVIGLTREMLSKAVLDDTTKVPAEFLGLIPRPGQSLPSPWDTVYPPRAPGEPAPL